MQNILSLVNLLAAEIGNIAAGIAVLTGFGAAIGMGLAVAKALESIAKQPEAHKKIQLVLIIGLAFIETVAIYGTFIAIMLIIM